MKLNHECVRDLLLSIEDFDSLTGWDSIATFSKNIKDKYSEDEIIYSAICLNEAGFIIATNPPDPRTMSIQRLTWEGHKFLDAIKSDTVWNQTKEKVTKSIGNASLTVISELASSVAKSMLGL